MLPFGTIIAPENADILEVSRRLHAAQQVQFGVDDPGMVDTAGRILAGSPARAWPERV